MIYYEAVEDNGDGTYTTRKFRTSDEAQQYIEQNEQWCYDGYYKVDTESPGFFSQVEDN